MAERQAARLFLTPRRRSTTDSVARDVQADRRFLSAGGHRVVAWSWGRGPLVLLVHGWSGRAGDMTAVAHALANEGFRAVAIDMPAHGASPGQRTSVAEWISVLCGAAPQLSTERPRAIIGHSAGAIAAALSLEAGLRASGAVLVAPAQGPDAYIERVRTSLGLPAARAAGLRRRVVEQVGRELPHFDALRAATVMSVPALILHDHADDVAPFAHAEAIARAWRGSELVTMSAIGHYRILQSATTTERVVSFVKGLQP